MNHNEFADKLSSDKYNKLDQETAIRNIIQEIIEERYGKDSPLSRLTKISAAFEYIKIFALQTLKNNKIEQITAENKEKVKKILINSDKNPSFLFGDKAFGITFEYGYDKTVYISFSTYKNNCDKDEFLVTIQECSGLDEICWDETKERIFNNVGLEIENRFVKKNGKKILGYSLTRPTDNINDFYTLLIKIYMGGKINKKTLRIDFDTAGTLKEYTTDLPETKDPFIIPDIELPQFDISKGEIRHKTDYDKVIGRIERDCKKNRFFENALKEMGLISKNRIFD